MAERRGLAKLTVAGHSGQILGARVIGETQSLDHPLGHT